MNIEKVFCTIKRLYIFFFKLKIICFTCQVVNYFLVIRKRSKHPYDINKKQLHSFFVRLRRSRVYSYESSRTHIGFRGQNRGYCQERVTNVPWLQIDPQTTKKYDIRVRGSFSFSSTRACGKRLKKFMSLKLKTRYRADTGRLEVALDQGWQIRFI